MYLIFFKMILYYNLLEYIYTQSEFSKIAFPLLRLKINNYNHFGQVLHEMRAIERHPIMRIFNESKLREEADS